MSEVLRGRDFDIQGTMPGERVREGLGKKQWGVRVVWVSCGILQ